MGDDDERRSNFGGALIEFSEAARTTGSLLRRGPDDPQRIYNHAQSEFWLGSLYYYRDDYKSAKTAFERYRDLANRLVKIDPKRRQWLKEAAYAEGNLCTIALSPPRNVTVAISSCTTSLNNMERAAGPFPDLDTAIDLANRHGWLADAYRWSGNLSAAEQERLAQRRILEPLTTANPKDMDIKERWALLQISLADLYAEKDEHLSRANLEAARRSLDEMVRIDPENTEFSRRRNDVL